MEILGWGAEISYGDPDHLIIFISGFVGHDVPRFHFGEFSQAMPQTRLLVRDHTNSLYSQGILGVTDNEDENLQFLQFFVKKIGARRVSIVAGSVGAFSAILWGYKLGVNDIHLAGPVTDMATVVESRRGSLPLFAETALYMRGQLAAGYALANLRGFMRDHPASVDCVDIYYGRQDPIDSQQAAVIEDLPEVRSTIYYQGDHFRVPVFLQRRDPVLYDRLMAPTVARPSDLRRSGRNADVDLGYAVVRLV